MSYKKKSEKQIAMTVSVNSIVVNVLLSLFKLVAGIIASSSAMISDAVHSASDVFSTFVVIIGVKMSSKDSDLKHQYGHERFECITSIILAVILAVTGVGIGIAGFEKIFTDDYKTLQIPGILALIAAVISIVVKEGMYWYTRKAAKRINSGALMADAWHHRSDSLSSIGSFIGILGARLGFPVLDSVASVVICGFIIWAAFGIFIDACKKLTDESCDQQTVDKMLEIIKNQPGVIGVDDIKTRIFGNKIYVDIEISADGDRSLNETHDIALMVHNAIEQNFPTVKHCMVHVNPA